MIKEAPIKRFQNDGHDQLRPHLEQRRRYQPGQAILRKRAVGEWIAAILLKFAN